MGDFFHTVYNSSFIKLSYFKFSNLIKGFFLLKIYLCLVIPVTLQRRLILYFHSIELENHT